MRSRVFFLTVSAAMVLLLAGTGRADLTPGQKQAVQALIGQFEAAEFDQRQKAVERLVELGPDVVALVQETLAGTDDEEVKLRCRMVLKGLAEKYGVGTETGGADAPPRRDLEPSRITLSVRNADLDDVLARFAEQSGNAPVLPPRDWEGQGVTLDLKDAPYWDALDELCRRTGCIYRLGQSTGAPGIELTAERDWKDVGVCVGPLVVKVGMVTRIRRYRPESFVAQPAFNQPLQPGETGEILCHLFCFWENRLSVASLELEVLKVAAPDAEVRKAETGFLYKGGGVSKGYGVERVSITGLADDVETLGTVEGVVRISADSGKERQVRVEDVLAPGQKTFRDGDLTVQVERMTGEEAATVRLLVRATRGGEDAAKDLFVEGPRGRYGVFLVDPQGRRHPVSDVAEQDERSLLIFRDLGQLDGNWTLLCVLPGKLERREYPFKIENVPVR